jgi:hypothetical protein
VLKVLCMHIFFIAIAKCSVRLCLFQLYFLGYVVSNNGLSMDESKVSNVKQWLSPITVHEVRSFHHDVDHVLHASKKISLSDETTVAFDVIMEKLTATQVLAFPDFS